MNTIYLTVTNAKGGVAKTTTAMHLATAFSNKGLDAEVWDADPQGSASGWAETAESLGEPLPFRVEAVNNRTLRSKSSKADIVLIDTPPAYADTIDLAVRRADLVLLLTSPSEADLEQVVSGISYLPQDKPYAVLITNANMRTKLYKDVLDFLKERDIPFFDHSIKSLQVIRTNWNHHPKDLAGYDSVADEISKIFRDGE